MSEDTELDQRPQSRREWHGVWRSLLLPLLFIAAIVGSIWYIDSRGLPFLGSKAQPSSVGPQDGSFYSFQSQGIKLGAAGGDAPKENQPAPDFTLLDIDGNTVKLSDLKGKTVILNFWATWCPPCRKEFPLLIDTYETNKANGLVVLGVDVKEAVGPVRKFVDNFGATYPILLDTNGSVTSQYRVQGLPFTWFIDSDGIARVQIIGALSEGIIKAALEATGFRVTP
jgi:peroxiredoxin